MKSCKECGNERCLLNQTEGYCLDCPECGVNWEKKMEFDKSRVFSSVNADELKAGDKVIVASTIAELKRIITGEIYCIAHIMRINDEDCENRFCIGESNATGDITYPLAYLVERAENCTNCGEGKWDAQHQKILCDPVNCGNGNVVFRNHEIEVCEYWKPITKQKAEHKCETCKYVNCGFKDFNADNKCDRWETERKAEKHTDYNHCEEARKAYACAMTNACPNKHYRPFKDTDELVKVWREKSKQVHSEYSLTMPYIWVRHKATKRTDLIVALTYTSYATVYADGNLENLFNIYEFLDGTPCGVEE